MKKPHQKFGGVFFFVYLYSVNKLKQQSHESKETYKISDHQHSDH